MFWKHDYCFDSDDCAVLDVVYDPTPTDRTEGSSYKTAGHLTARLTNNLPANNPKPKFKKIKQHL